MAKVWDIENNPIKSIENELQKAAAYGHDIQLHVHPQWIGSSASLVRILIPPGKAFTIEKGKLN